jgi:DNA topoisomerase-1
MQDGVERALSATDINEFIKERTGGEFTAKDFRTLRGTAAAAQSLAHSLAAACAGEISAAHPPKTPPRSRRADNRAIAEAMRQAADVLGNTPAIARTSYVDPRVVDLFLVGETIDPAGRVSVETALRELFLGDGA